MESLVDQSQTSEVPQGIVVSDVGQGGAGVPLDANTPVNLAGDLTNNPQFRQWQSAKDKEVADERAARLRETQEKAALQQQLDVFQEQQLASLSPEEQVAAYKQRDTERTEHAAEQQAHVRFVNEAMEACAEAGVDWNTDPFVGNVRQNAIPNAEGLAALHRAVTRSVLARTRAQTAQAQQQASEVSQRARVDALNAAGVTQTSTSAPSAIPRNRADDDKAEMRKEYRAAMGKGEEARMTFVEKWRRKGYTTDDL